MILDLLYISLILFAIISLQSSVLRNAVIYLTVFSLLSSAAYLFLGAPDVAIAEAVIGCTLSTILYLVALKKYKIISVYYRFIASQNLIDSELAENSEHIRDLLSTLTDQLDLQLDFITTTSSLSKMIQTNFDMIIIHSPKGLFIHGLENNYHFVEMSDYLKSNLTLPVSIFHLDEMDDEFETTQIPQQNEEEK
jgi:putative multicomponent Na+:H+ antiporter subunit B